MMLISEHTNTLFLGVSICEEYLKTSLPIKNGGSFTNSVKFNFHFVAVATMQDPTIWYLCYVLCFQACNNRLAALDNA